MHWSEYHAECVCTHCTHRTELQNRRRSGGCWQWFHETDSNVLEPGDICCEFLWPFRPSIARGTRPPRSTILPSCNTQASNGNVATIVLLASRRGIISAHCHRLIEFGIDRIAHVDRPTVAMNAMHVQCRHKQKGTGFSILSVVAPSMRSSKGARFECLYC